MQDLTTSRSMAAHPVDNVHQGTPTTSAFSWPDRLRYLASVDADGDVPTVHGTRLATDINPDTGRPWEAAFVEVTVHYVSPVSPDDTVFLIVDGADGRGRALVIADGQDHAECEGWLYGHKVTLAGRRTELFGAVGLDIRRAPKAVAA